MALTDIDLTALPIPIHFGADALARVGQIATNTGGTRALIVTDQGAPNHIFAPLVSRASSTTAFKKTQAPLMWSTASRRLATVKLTV
jgi:alcohol dehydrogenase class IV